MEFFPDIPREVGAIRTIGVILLNLGGPDSLNSVRPFLYNLFSDREIIKLGTPSLQKPLAWLIATLRSAKAEGMYRCIGGGSPMLSITSAQAVALEKALKETCGADERLWKVYVGMRYWHPFIEDAVKRMCDDGVRTAVALSLYPQYSLATTGSALTKFKEEADRHSLETSCVASWFDHPLYIDALSDVIEKGLDSFQKGDADLLFSAHSLPVRIIESGDPYVEQVLGTIGEVVKKVNARWHLSYQSKSGPVKWLSPSTEERIAELAEGGVKNLLVVPISFVSDHIETLYEIDILYKRYADRLGINLVRTQSLNTHPLFIDALKDLVMKAVEKEGWLGTQTR